MTPRKVTYSRRPNHAARAAHARGEKAFRTYDTSAIRPIKSKTPLIAAIVVLLIIIGGNMIKEAMGEDEKVDACMDATEMFLLAIATSIDALAVGVTFAFLKVQIVPAVSFIGCVTFVCSAIGVKIGSIFGSKYRSKAEFCGGVILILIGLKILLNGLGIM